MKKVCLGLMFLVFFLCNALAPQAGEVTLAWDPNTEEDLAGYIICRGTEATIYTDCVDVGDILTHTFEAVPTGVMCYYVAYAYNLEDEQSGPSNEVAYALPALDSDGDGLGDDIEDAIGTYANDPDSDDDGIPDGAEFEYWGRDPSLDSDGDYLPNIIDPDSDDDGWLDGQELAYGSDPADPGSVPFPPPAGNVRAEIIGGQVVISWEPVIGHELVDGYRVYYSAWPNAATPLVIAVEGEASASLILPDHVLGFPALYVSVATSGLAGEGERSAEIAVALPASNKVENVGGYLAPPDAWVTWNQVTGASGYKVYYSYVPSAKTPIVKSVSGGATTTYKITYGANYPALYVSVSAIVNGVEGPRSAEVRLK